MVSNLLSKRDMSSLTPDTLLQFNLSKLQKINGRLGVKGSCKLCKAEFIGLMYNGKLGWEGSHQSSCPISSEKEPSTPDAA